MSNRLESASPLPLIMDPVQAMKLGQAINASQRQTEQTIALGDAFKALIQDITGVFSWIGRSINSAVEMRSLFELNDRQLSDLGIERSQIAALCAQGRLDAALDGKLRS